MTQEQNANSNPESNEQEAPEISMGQSVSRSTIGLGLFAILTAGLIAITQLNTSELIEEQVKLARSKALFEIVPLSEHDNDLLNDAFWIKASALGLSEKSEAFIAKSEGQAQSIILPVVAPKGYSGPIRLIVGIDQSATIKGVRVIQHKETPGLGDKIELKKSDWITDFNGKSLVSTPAEAWKVKKDGGEFDQLTGATITPRAIVQAVYEALQFFEANKDQLLNQPPGAEFKTTNP